MRSIHPAQTSIPAKEAEIELIARAQRDPLAFRALYELYARPVYRYLYSRVGSQAEAEDLTSQVFLQALEGLRKFRNQGNFQAWLFAIAHSRAMDYFRKSGRELLLDEVELISGDPDPPATAVRQDEVRRMRAHILALAEDDQELIRLRFVAGLSFADIGAVLGRSQGAVKKALYRLLARLKAQMEAGHD